MTVDAELLTDEPDRPAALARTADHGARAHALLARLLRDKPRVTALLAAWSAQVQAAEDALWSLLVDTTLAAATGAPLDQLGELLGEARQGLADAPYRAVLRATVLALRSEGTGDELLAICAALLGVPAVTSADVTLTEHAPAAVVVAPAGPWALTGGAPAARVLARAVAAGVGLQVLDPPATGDWFTFASTLAPVELDPARGLGDVADPATGGPLVGVYA